MTTLSPEIIEELKKMARRDSFFDDPGVDSLNAFEASGGNYDEAYYLGVDEGEIRVARTVLSALGIDWNT